MMTAAQVSRVGLFHGAVAEADDGHGIQTVSDVDFDSDDLGCQSGYMRAIAFGDAHAAILLFGTLRNP